MPELPEVETIVRGLQSVLPGRRIVEVRLGKTDFIDDPAALEKELPEKRIVVVRRYGKFLLFEMESANGGTDSRNLSLLIHLGMTGRLVVCRPDVQIAPHTHAFFSLDDGQELRYTDIRRFGRIGLLHGEIRETALGQLGLDPLEATEDEFMALVGTRKARIKSLLLDQGVLRGIGNIYADESLWRARIHPMRVGASLKKDELRRLWRAVREVLAEAIRLRGSSVSDYVDSEGNLGKFQRRHRVYMRNGKKCFRCGSIIRRAIVAGRGTHFCARCQSAPRARRKAR